MVFLIKKKKIKQANRLFCVQWLKNSQKKQEIQIKPKGLKLAAGVLSSNFSHSSMEALPPLKL